MDGIFAGTPPSEALRRIVHAAATTRGDFVPEPMGGSMGVDYGLLIAGWRAAL